MKVHRERQTQRINACATLLGLPTKDKHTAILDLMQAIPDQEQQDLVVSIVQAMERECRHDLLAQLLVLTEQDAPVFTTKPRIPAADDFSSFTDRAEALLIQNPDGLTTRDVAEMIGQQPASTDGTLRSIAQRRKTIERRDGLWFPVNARGQFQREILEAFQRVEYPLTASMICERMPLFDSDMIVAELARMHQDGLLIVGSSPSIEAFYYISETGKALLTQ